MKQITNITHQWKVAGVECDTMMEECEAVADIAIVPQYNNTVCSKIDDKFHAKLSIDRSYYSFST